MSSANSKRNEKQPVCEGYLTMFLLKENGFIKLESMFALHLAEFNNERSKAERNSVRFEDVGGKNTKDVLETAESVSQS